MIFYFFAGARQQEPVVEALTYISPVPGSRYIMPGNNIALRHGEPFDPASLHPALLEVRGLKGELISGKAVLSDDERTFIFLPDRSFGLGEEITVKLNPGLKTISGIPIAPVEFNFYVTGEVIPVDEAFVDKFILEKGPGLIRPENLQLPASGKGMKNDLPPGYLSLIHI
mgnify:FL=1